MSRITIVATSSLLLVLLVLSGLLDPFIHQPDMSDQDIYYSWVEGGRLLNAENPYARALQGNMRSNNKYATYFPVFYEASYLSERLGLVEFPAWLAFWRVVFIGFEWATAVLMYWALARRRLPWVGVFAAAFWLFNRWTLQLLQVVNLDFVPLFFLLISLELFPRNKWLSLFLFSMSLGVKQIAIFVTPLYLIWIWQSSKGNRVKDLLLGAAVIASVPFISSIPFLLWSPRALVYSVLFSLTRDASQTKSLAPAVSIFLDGRTLYDRILMFGLMLSVYVLAWRMPAARYLAALLVMLAFVCFNPVLFVQYILWTIGLSLLVICDVRDVLVASSPPQPAPA